MNEKKLKVTLVKSKHGRLRTHKACIVGLGIRRMNQTVILQDTPEVRGMVNRVSYMLKVEEA
jgi:large subunit ribosomal protein L30